MSISNQTLIGCCLCSLLVLSVIPARAAVSDCYDHYNPDAWNGQGTAIVFCRNNSDDTRGSFITSCEIRYHGGAKIQGLTRHGNLDKERVIYTDYNTTGDNFNFDIDIVCSNADGETLTFEIGNGSQPHTGCCRNLQCGSVACCGDDCSSSQTPDSAAPSPDLGTSPCSGIAADPDYELCQATATSCAGVFTDGSGCIAFCNAAGMKCVAHHGGEAGCVKESSTFGCAEDSTHSSDWCECQINTPPPPDVSVAPLDQGTAPLPDYAPYFPDLKSPHQDHGAEDSSHTASDQRLAVTDDFETSSPCSCANPSGSATGALASLVPLALLVLVGRARARASGRGGHGSRR